VADADDESLVGGFERPYKPPAPPGPYQFLGVYFGGRPPERFAIPVKYALWLPHRRGAPTGQRFFNIGRYFDHETDLARPISTLVRWAAAAVVRDGVQVRSIKVYARVTDEIPGFGFVPTSRTLSAIAAMGAELDVSVYIA
jgi:hypothetical protein